MRRLCYVCFLFVVVVAGGWESLPQLPTLIFFIFTLFLSSPPPAQQHNNRDFITNSLYRKQLSTSISTDGESMPGFVSGVTLLCGTRKDSGHRDIITVLFDRSLFSEQKAREWWSIHRDGIVLG